MSQGFATAYTDISGSRGIWAYSYYVRCDQGVLSKAELIDVPVTDTNHAEMLAIIKVVGDIIRKFDNIERVLVVTDSKNAQHILWHGTTNPKYFALVDQIRQLEEKVQVLIKWTKGHSRDDSDRTYLNGKCDKNSRKVVKEYLRLHNV